MAKTSSVWERTCPQQASPCPTEVVIADLPTAGPQVVVVAGASLTLPNRGRHR